MEILLTFFLSCVSAKRSEKHVECLLERLEGIAYQTSIALCSLGHHLYLHGLVALIKLIKKLYLCLEEMVLDFQDLLYALSELLLNRIHFELHVENDTLRVVTGV